MNDLTNPFIIGVPSLVGIDDNHNAPCPYEQLL